MQAKPFFTRRRQGVCSLAALLLSCLLTSCGGSGNSSTSTSSGVVGSSSSSSSSSSSGSSSSSSSSSGTGLLTLQETGAGICLVQGAIESQHAGFTGAGYANTSNAEGLGLVWHVYTAQPGQYEMTLRYANGADARPAIFSVNGKNPVALDFPSTGAWTNWQSSPITIDLIYGNNTFMLAATQANGLANIDALNFTRNGVQPGNCATGHIIASGALTAGSPIAFSAETFAVGADSIVGFDWSFADGTAGSGKNVSHTYLTPGTKTVILTMTDRDGGQSVVQRTVEIKTAASGPIKVFIAGDSTVSTYADTASANDQAGWGQMLPLQYNNQVTVDNRAIGGRSARRFIDEGHLDAIWRDSRAGDYVLVQFGTNDGHRTATYTINGQTIPYYLEPQTDFKSWLQKYVDGAKARELKLVFVTPPPRNSAYCTGGNGTGAHAQAMRELAAVNGVPLVDLNAKLVTYLMNICPAPVPENFFLLRADGTVDGTHFQEHGARVMSSMVADGMAEAALAIDQFRR